MKPLRGEMDQVKFGWKLACGALLFGAIVILVDFQIQKTACVSLSDREALAILQPAFVHIKSRSRPEDMGSLRLETKIHRDGNYAPDDPNSNVWVDLVDVQTSQSIYHMHLFADCDIETWGSSPSAQRP
jgi:hypothetical protein